MNLYNLAGIVGLRPILKYDKAEDRCSATFPGYGRTIAELPLNTIDAVMTSGGLMAYKSGDGDLRAVQVPDHQEIYDYVSVMPDPPSSIMIRQREYIKNVNAESNPHRSGSVIQNKLEMKSIFPEQSRSLPEQENAMENRSDVCIEEKIRFIVEKLTREFMQNKVSAMIQQLEKMMELNAKMARQIEEIERGVACGRPDVIAADPSGGEADGFEIAWSDRGGLPNNLSSLDNPFSVRRR